MTDANTAEVQRAEEEVPALIPDPITFTDAAVAKVKALMDEEGNPNLKLRVFCAGRRLCGLSVRLYIR